MFRADGRTFEVEDCAHSSTAIDCVKVKQGHRVAQRAKKRSFDEKEDSERKKARSENNLSDEISPLCSKTSKPDTVPEPRSDRIVQKFVLIVYDMLRDGDPSIVRWAEDGGRVVIVDPGRLVSEICPKYFQLNKFESFIRQLYIHQFRKVRQFCDAANSMPPHVYEHAYFKRDRPDLLHLIQRKKGSPGTSSEKAAIRDANATSTSTNEYNSSPALLEPWFVYASTHKAKLPPRAISTSQEYIVAKKLISMHAGLDADSGDSPKRRKRARLSLLLSLQKRHDELLRLITCDEGSSPPRDDEKADPQFWTIWV